LKQFKNQKKTIEIMKKSFVAVVVIAMALVIGGCAKVPQVELDAANSAILKASVAEANVYMEAEYTAIIDSMKIIEAEVEMNKGKLFKNFDDVKVKLANIEATSMQLVVSTVAKKEAIVAEVNQILADLKTLTDETTVLAEQAPKGKEGKAAIEAIKGELTAVGSSAAEIPGMLEQGKLMPAKAKAQAAYDKAVSLNVELTTVVEKYNSKKK